MLLNLLKKYAADLLVRVLLEALEKMAPKTDNKIDDRIVEILKAERDIITKTITKQIGG
jgi:hypothetical protein